MRTLGIQDSQCLCPANQQDATWTYRVRNRGQAKEGPGRGINGLSEEMQNGEAGARTPCFSGGRRRGLTACCPVSPSMQAVELSVLSAHLSRRVIYSPQLGGRQAGKEAMATACRRLVDTQCMVPNGGAAGDPEPTLNSQQVRRVGELHI